MKLVLGYILSIIPYRKWIIFYDRLVSSVQESKYMGTPVAEGKHYFKGRLNKDILLPTNIGYFEGEKVAMPNNYHEYLRNTYGDYMKIPDVGDRKMHFAISLVPNNRL
jgi:phosphorylcholine metabolism protein LicD